MFERFGEVTGSRVIEESKVVTWKAKEFEALWNLPMSLFPPASALPDYGVKVCGFDFNDGCFICLRIDRHTFGVYPGEMELNFGVIRLCRFLKQVPNRVADIESA
jgi:hypothetical protein